MIYYIFLWRVNFDLISVLEMQTMHFAVSCPLLLHYVAHWDVIEMKNNGCSRVHRMPKLWPPDGHAMASRIRVSIGSHRVAIGKLRVSFVFPSYVHRECKFQFVPDEHTTKEWRTHDDSRLIHDALTNVPMDTRCTHEVNTITDLRVSIGRFFGSQRFSEDTRTYSRTL